MSETASGSVAVRQVLVTDSEPRNGGDCALLVGLIDALAARWPGAAFTVLTSHPEYCRDLLPAVRFENAVRPEQAHDAVAEPGSDEAAAIGCYRAADLVLSMPGGHLHEYYDVTPRLEGFALARRLGRPLALFGQSIGPFADACRRQSVIEALRGASLIAVRDGVSHAGLTEWGFREPVLAQVPDAAFLWRHTAPELFRSRTGPPRRVAISLRRWPRRGSELFRETARKARRLIEMLAARGVQEFLFLSTCQGVPGYTDDSEMADRVLAGLEPSLQSRCHVDRASHAPRELIARYAACDLFVGMRLHGCVLAMLGGTPAFGLGYEPKTPEIFKALGLGAYQVPFTATATRWCQGVATLLDDYDRVSGVLAQRLDAQAQRAVAGLSLLDRLIANSH